jgi:hypothetical protein
MTASVGSALFALALGKTASFATPLAIMGATEGCAQPIAA